MPGTGYKLNEQQKDTLLEWIAAEYSSRLIRHWFQQHGWPEITRQGIHHYRQRFREEIEQKRQERRGSALTRGLALREERVKRLAAHADVLEEIKWDTDDKGRCWNEKAWRETLDDIAREMGHRKLAVEGDVHLHLKRYENVDVEDV
jgi:hypothetical protein